MRQSLPSNTTSAAATACADFPATAGLAIKKKTTHTASEITRAQCRIISPLQFCYPVAEIQKLLPA
jgi:hypothetical protein